MADKIKITPDELRAQASKVDAIVSELDSINTQTKGIFDNIVATGSNVIKNISSKTNTFMKTTGKHRDAISQAAGMAREAADTFQNMDQVIRKNIGDKLPEDIKNSPPSSQKVPTPLEQRADELMNTDGFREGEYWGYANTYVDYHNGQPILGSQCFAMAHMMQVEITGKRGYSIGSTNFDDIQPGDVIHYYGAGAHPKYGHWVFVISKTPNSIIIAEGNGEGEKIHWYREISRDSINSIVQIDR